VDFDPFLSGTGVLTDTPFRQESQRGRYNMTIAVNELNTDPSGFPDHAEPTTGNVFEYGSFTFGFDPDTVRQEYTRQTAEADRLTGLNRTTDNAGLIPRVEVSGRIDGAGAHALWSKARNNELSYLSAEFQNGWALLSKVLVANDPDTPDFVTGLYRYTAEFVIVKDPSSGIGDVTAVIDKEVKDSGTYVGDPDTGNGQPDSVTWAVDSGSAPIGGQTSTWSESSVSVRLGGATNYVYAADPDGDGTAEVRINQSAVPSDTAGLSIVSTDDTGITNIDDIRDTNTSGGGGTVGEIGYEITGGSGALQDDFVQWDTVTVDVDLNATNYVFVVDPDGDGQGTVTVNQSGVPSDALPLWKVTTDGDGVTDEVDLRDKLIGDPPPDGSDVAFSTALQVDDEPGLSFNIGPDFADSVADPSLSQAYLSGLLLSEPVTDPSDSVLTALGLSQLVQQQVQLSDGGTSTTGRSETIVWETASDWDSNTSSNLVHESVADTDHNDATIVQKGIQYDPLPVTNGLVFYYPLHDSPGSSAATDISGNGNDANLANGSFGGPGLFGNTALDCNDEFGVYPFTDSNEGSFAADAYSYGGWVNTDSYQGRNFHGQTDNTSTLALRGLSGGKVELYHDDGSDNLITSSSGVISTNEWNFWFATFDGSTATLYVNDTKIGQKSVGSLLGLTRMAVGSAYTFNSTDSQTSDAAHYDRALSQSEVQSLYEYGKPTTTLTTATKSFSTSGKPDLTNLVYTLNGQTVKLSVTGSPGTGAEETVTVGLSGGTSFSLNWTNSHSDFQVEIELTTTDLSVTPTVDRVELSLDSSSDSDQNPQTDWSLSPGIYDRAANEYEGGGITLRHGD